MKTNKTLGCSLFAGVGVWFSNVSVATAQATQTTGGATPAQPTFLGSLMDILPLLLICYVIFWAFVIRPQDEKAKQHKALLESLKKGDSVVTSSGIVGKVAGIEKEHLLLEVAQNVRVKVLLSHVARLESEPQKA